MALEGEMRLYGGETREVAKGTALRNKLVKTLVTLQTVVGDGKQRCRR